MNYEEAGTTGKSLRRAAAVRNILTAEAFVNDFGDRLLRDLVLAMLKIIWMNLQIAVDVGVRAPAKPTSMADIINTARFCMSNLHKLHASAGPR